MGVFRDIYNYIMSLSLVDIIFLGAIIVLLILIVTLIYFIKINKDEVLEIQSESNEKKEDIVDMITNNIESVKEEEFNDEEGELLDLNSLTEKLKNEENNPEQVKIDNYEKEQEEKAIISYDELIKKKNHYAINYEKEELIDDLSVKKVNLNDLVNKEIEDSTDNKVQVISYQKEEEFLKALKELNSLLN